MSGARGDGEDVSQWRVGDEALFTVEDVRIAVAARWSAR